MLFDTDVLVWLFRGSGKASKAVDEAGDRSISIVTYMELMQGARSKIESRNIKGFLSELDFLTLPLTENIGHRAAIYIEEYGLRESIGVVDALVAATAVENSMTLFTANQKHYRAIKDLHLKVFKP